MPTTTPGVPPRTGYIRILIQFGAHYQLFDMEKHKPLGTAMHRFAKKTDHELWFHYEGARIQETDTPVSLNMDDELGAEAIHIDVSLMQVRRQTL